MNLPSRFYRFARRHVTAALTDWRWRDPDVKPVWVGSRTGGAWVDLTRLNDTSVVYSFGIAFEISFDREILQRTGCRVVGFDPDLRSAEWIHSGRVWVPDRFTFEPLGIYSSSGNRQFHTTGADQMTGSVVYDYRGQKMSAQFLTLEDIMARRGDVFVDLVKMDIEGAEYDVLGDWLSRHWAPPVGQLWVEFHPLLRSRTAEETERFVRDLGAIGFRPAKRAYPDHYLLVGNRNRGEHARI
jgi:FkbM family methyltransferase